MYSGFSYSYFASFFLHGFNNYYIAEVESGLIEIKDDIDFYNLLKFNDRNIAIVSDVFAYQNNLEVSSITPLTSLIFDLKELDYGEVSFSENNIVLEQTWEIEIIGIFEIIHSFEYNIDNYRQVAMEEYFLQNRIFLPNFLVEEINEFNYKYKSIYEPYSIVSNPSSPNFTSLFVFDNFNELVDFVEISNDLLPEFWIMRDLSDNLRTVRIISDSLKFLSSSFLIICLIIGIVVNVFIIITLINSRRKELFILHSLGKAKIRIFLVTITEFFIYLFCSIVIGNVIGRIITNTVGNQFIKYILSNRQFGDINFDWHIDNPISLRMFTPQELTIDNYIEAIAMTDNIFNNLIFTLFILVLTFVIIVVSINTIKIKI